MVFRYDMLCFEGIALNLNVFLGRQEFPTYRVVPPANGEIQTMIVHEPVSSSDLNSVAGVDSFLDQRCPRISSLRSSPQYQIHKSPL
jgi:hypothetical protein